MAEYQLRHCINLYHEKKRHPSWEQGDHFYTTLGTELSSCHKVMSEKIRVGIVGRITQEKLPLKFLEKLVQFKDDRYKFKIYGQKDEMFGVEYNKKFDKLIQNSTIEYLGFKDSGQIYSDLDVLLIPSEYETGSFTCIEAIANGVVVIARNVYGMKFLINDDIGYLCENDDEILKTLTELTREKLAQKSFCGFLAGQKFDITQKIPHMESVFQDLILKEK